MKGDFEKWLQSQPKKDLGDGVYSDAPEARSVWRKTIKVSELSGAKLDYWVAKAIGLDTCPRSHITSRLHTDFCFMHQKPITERYSTDWSQGGPIILRERISILYEEYKPYWSAHESNESAKKNGRDYIDMIIEYDEDPLIAAMRCYVASKYGESVDDSQANHD